MFWSITSLISLGTFENFVKLQEITMNLLNKVIIITSGDNEFIIITSGDNEFIIITSGDKFIITLGDNGNYTWNNY